MKTPEHDRLLRDILATREYTDFRDDLAKQLRRQLKQRRFNRTAGYLALAASLMFLAVLILRPPHRPATFPHQMVRTEVLDAGSLVRTTPQHMIEVSTVPLPQIVQTATHGQPVENLTDEQLLALFPETPVALVSNDSGRRELLFLDSAGPQILRPEGDRAWQ